MAARNVRDAGTYGTWGISPTVRRALARNIMELRSAVEDDFRKQIVGLGLRPTRAVNPRLDRRTWRAGRWRASD